MTKSSENKSNPSSTSGMVPQSVIDEANMESLRREVLASMLKENERSLIALEIKEQFLSRKAVIDKSGNANVEMLLGRTQSEIKETKEIIEFLKEKIHE